MRFDREGYVRQVSFYSVLHDQRQVEYSDITIRQHFIIFVAFNSECLPG
jgi:hypothetical protein